jgi:hypothetical protein
VAHALHLVDKAVACGIARRLSDGRAVFDSSCPGFPTVILTRGDGFPTEHARVVAVFHRLFTGQPGPAVHLDYNGTEWEHAQSALTQFMRALDLIPRSVTHLPAIHGMVVARGGALSSSQDEPPMIDDLVSALTDSPEIGSVLGDDDPSGAYRAVAADIVIKAFFLSTARAKPLIYSWDRLVDQTANRGWTVARAWCRHLPEAGAAHHVPQAEAVGVDSSCLRASHDPTDPDYRVAVLQAEAFPLELSKSLEPDGDIDLSHLISYLVLTARRLLDAPPGSARCQVSHAALRSSLGLLGFRTHPD